MASRRLAQSVFRCTANVPATLVATTPRASCVRAQVQRQSNPSTSRFLHTTQKLFAEPTSKAAEAIQTPQAQPPPDQDPEPARHAAFLGEADSDDGFETYKDTHGDPPPSLDATNSAFHGEADSDDGFEAQKAIDGEKLDAVDATQSAYLGEADSDDGFEGRRAAYPEEGDHKIENPVESGLHGQTGELDQGVERH